MPVTSIAVGDGIRVHQIIKHVFLPQNSWLDVIGISELPEITVLNLCERRTKIKYEINAHILLYVSLLDHSASLKSPQVQIVMPSPEFLGRVLPHIELTRALIRTDSHKRLKYESKLLEVTPQSRVSRELKQLLGVRRSNCLNCDSQIYQNDILCQNKCCRHCHSCGAKLNKFCHENIEWYSMKKNCLKLIEKYIVSVKSAYPSYFA